MKLYLPLVKSKLNRIYFIIGAHAGERKRGKKLKND